MRIGNMGVQASPDYLVTAVTALAAGLRDFGIDANVGKAVEAIVEAFR